MKTENGKLKKYKLGEYIDSFGDGIHGTPNYDEKGEYYFINGNNLKDGQLNITEDTLKISSNEYSKIKRRLIPNNTILVSINGTLGNVALYKSENIALGKSACYLNLKDSSFRFFLRYLLKTKEFKNYMNRVAGQSTIKNVSPTQISEYEFFAPPLESQQKIAAVLSALDDKIALNNRMNAKLEQMAKRLYDYWFVQFDFPNADDKPYKSTGGKMVWNETLKREIPDGWEVGNLYDIAEYVNGLACQNYRPKESEKSLPVIKIREMNEGITADTEKVSASIPGKYRIYAGDILFSWSASLEIKIWTGETGGLNQHIFKVIPKGYFSKGYVYQQLSAYLVNFQKMAESRKTTMGHITSDHIKQSRILIPPKEIISAFTKKTLSIFNYQLSIEKETQKLTALRDRLLPLLMNGQVVVE